VGALAMVEAELDRGPPTDLVLLPEASLTGYVSRHGDFDLTPFAEAEGGPTARAIADLARRRRVNLVAPLVLCDQDEGGDRDTGAGRRCSNAMVAFDRRGEPLFTYRKRHPWIPETWATAGTEEAPVIDIEGAWVTIAMCYDLHFLDEDAVDALTRADLLLFPSAWVESPDSRAARPPRRCGDRAFAAIGSAEEFARAMLGPALPLLSAGPPAPPGRRRSARRASGIRS
jgi:predicted amidohydrolase